MVRTLDFESSDPGSNPGRSWTRVAQWIRRLTSNQEIAGSSPVVGVEIIYLYKDKFISFFDSIMASISACHAEDLGSIPSRRALFGPMAQLDRAPAYGAGDSGFKSQWDQIRWSVF